MGDATKKEEKRPSALLLWRYNLPLDMVYVTLFYKVLLVETNIQELSWSSFLFIKLYPKCFSLSLPQTN